MDLKRYVSRTIVGRHKTVLCVLLLKVCATIILSCIFVFNVRRPVYVVTQT